ncbi:hypothetical protein CGCSCA4_v004642 [Colletotrichum siamense]|uniref:Uncharacterized protein n=1 Tax=Colletotrichum siamense TaxID=690259 RepID=A0A9P5K808_COLSI|nr:hypothetical protein CGCSCA4_v004642 [Colletotrichum siamense]KAF4861625.1 hypothetical protein CGCSCA2_v004408 [Colletotrichum siamense]
MRASSNDRYIDASRRPPGSSRHCFEGRSEMLQPGRDEYLCKLILGRFSGWINRRRWARMFRTGMQVVCKMMMV